MLQLVVRKRFSLGTECASSATETLLPLASFIRHHFASIFGPRIVSAYDVASSKEVKQLKGPDRDKVTSLQDCVADAVRHVLDWSVCHEIESYFKTVGAALKGDQVEKLPSSVFPTDSGTPYIRNMAFSEEVGNYLDVCNELSSNLKKLENLNALNAMESQLILQQWRNHSEKLVKLFDPSAAPSDRLKEDYATKQKALMDVVTDMESSVSACLGSNVHSEALQHVKTLVEFVGDVLIFEEAKKNGTADASSLNIDKFLDTLQACRRMTSVMGEEGKLIRRGVVVLECAAKSSSNFFSAKSQLERKSVEDMADEFELAAIKAIYFIFSPERREKSIANLAALMKHIHLSKVTLPTNLHDLESKLVKFLDDMVQKSDACINVIRDYLEKTFAKVRMNTFTFALPDEVKTVADIDSMITKEFGTVIQTTFPTEKSEGVVNMAVQAETIESVVEKIVKETDIRSDHVAPWMGECQRMRRDSLSWLSET